MDWNAWSAAGTVAAAIIALFALALSSWTLFVQTRLAHFSSNLDNLWHLEDAFGADDLRTSRAIAAALLLTGQPLAKASPHQLRALHNVLDFFELVGYLVEKHALDADTAWMDFCDWALSYWTVSKGYIEGTRVGTPAFLDNYKLLVTRFEKMERDRGDWSDGQVPPAELNALLQREADQTASAAPPA